MIKRGDEVKFLPEWQDEGDADGLFIAKEDQIGDRVLVESQCGLMWNPTAYVKLFMIEGT